MKDNNVNLSTILLGTTIHDLRTHLTAIIAAAELLSDESIGMSETQIKLNNAIIRNAKTMDGKLSKILKTKTYFDGVKPPEESVNLLNVLRESVVELAPVINNSRQVITIDAPEDLPDLTINQQYIDYIIRTLLHNASKFTPPDGSIKMVVKVDDNSIILGIIDSGIGIPQSAIEHIFDSHYQVSGFDQDDHAGSGVGLSMAKYIAEIIGGKLWVNSTVGQGSSFFVSFPILKEKEMT